MLLEELGITWKTWNCWKTWRCWKILILAPLETLNVRRQKTWRLSPLLEDVDFLEGVDFLEDVALLEDVDFLEDRFVGRHV